MMMQEGNLDQHGEDRSWPTHYIAGWLQGNCSMRCFHQHKTVAEAAACMESPTGFVKAVTNNCERPLNPRENEVLISSLLRRALDAEKLVGQDCKTGVLNDRKFKEILADEIRRSRRDPGPTTVVFLDLDGFKAVNTHLGHHTADLILKVVAGTMQNTLREVDKIARFGGDEFILLLHRANGESAHTVMDKLQKALKDTMHAYSWEVTFSAGVVTFKTPPAAADYMIEAAEKLMRVAKGMGKNHVSYSVRDC
jgi:two-component system, cell cycle response regulator